MGNIRENVVRWGQSFELLLCFFDLVYLLCRGKTYLKTYDSSNKWNWDPTSDSHLVIIRLRHVER